MCYALKDHKCSVRIAGLIFIEFRFTDNIIFYTEEEEEEKADDIATSMDTICIRHKMEIGLDKTKMMTRNLKSFKERTR